MKKEGSVLPIVLTIALIIGGGLFFIARANSRRRKELEDKLKEQDVKGDGAVGDGGLGGVGKPMQTPTNYGFTFPIKYGDKGENVRQMQMLILDFDKRMLFPFGADGKFGSVTETALNKIIGKKRVESQADIDLLKNKTVQKASKLFGSALINAQLGLPIK